VAKSQCQNRQYLAEFNTKSIKRVKQRLDPSPHYYAEKLLDSQLAFTEFPNAIVNQNQLSGQLSIDPGLARRYSCPPFFVADWRAGLLTISQPHHPHEGRFTV